MRINQALQIDDIANLMPAYEVLNTDTLIVQELTKLGARRPRVLLQRSHRAQPGARNG